VVIHQEFGNLGIQNRKGLSMPSADMALVSFNGKLVLIVQKYWKSLLCFNGYCKAIFIAAHNRAQTKWIFKPTAFLIGE